MEYERADLLIEWNMTVNILYTLTPDDLQQEADHQPGTSALTGIPGFNSQDSSNPL